VDGCGGATTSAETAALTVAAGRSKGAGRAEEEGTADGETVRFWGTVEEEEEEEEVEVSAGPASAVPSATINDSPVLIPRDSSVIEGDAEGSRGRGGKPRRTVSRKKGQLSLNVDSERITYCPASTWKCSSYPRPSPASPLEWRRR